MTCWLNVDRPTQSCRLHSSRCGYATRREGTPFKGVGRLLRDGGWLRFPSPADAYEYAKRKFPKAKFRASCARCP
jgi:hypothetical protein